jgi:hypothetical protein
MINWDNFKCRCSAIAKLLTTGREGQQITEKQHATLKDLEKRPALSIKQAEEVARLQTLLANKDKVVFGDTAIDYLMEHYAWETQGAVSVLKELELEQTKKGNLAEQDAINLLSIVEGVVYRKYEGERITNEYLSGLPDVFKGADIMAAEKITDIKNSFDYPIFLKQLNKPLENGYEFQLKGYCDITGAPEAEVARCLVSMPEIMQLDFRRRLSYQWGYVSDESPEFLKRWGKMHRSMNFDHISCYLRVNRIKVEPFTDFERERVYDRVKQARDWLWKFEENYNKLNQ